MKLRWKASGETILTHLQIRKRTITRSNLIDDLLLMQTDKSNQRSRPLTPLLTPVSSQPDLSYQHCWNSYNNNTTTILSSKQEYSMSHASFHLQLNPRTDRSINRLVEESVFSSELPQRKTVNTGNNSTAPAFHLFSHTIHPIHTYTSNQIICSTWNGNEESNRI